MTYKFKKGVMKMPKKEDSKNRIIQEQRKTIRKLVKENKRLRNQVYDLNKVLDKNLKRIEMLSERYTLEELLDLDVYIDEDKFVGLDEDPSLTEEQILDIIKGE